MHTVEIINFIIMCLFFACYMYQFLYIPISWMGEKKPERSAPLHRFAVLIAARNEESVIGQLIDSIKIPKSLSAYSSWPTAAATPLRL